MAREPSSKTPPSDEQRVDPAFAAAWFDRMYPEPAKQRAAMELLAESIRMADKHGTSRWIVTLNRYSIMVDVGTVWTIELCRNGIKLLIAREGLDARSYEDLKDHLGPGQKAIDNYGLPTASILLSLDEITPMASLRLAYPSLFIAQEQVVKVAVKERNRRPGHSPGVLAFLRALEFDVPEPLIQPPLPVDQSSINPMVELDDLDKQRNTQTLTSSMLDPASDEDARAWVLRAIVQRQGQGAFRDGLLKAYNRRCAISDCDAISALEAAHIIGYRGKHTYQTSNGLLLRADLHTLFDLHLLAIEPTSMTVVLSPTLSGTVYQQFDGKSLHLPSDQRNQPDKYALASHLAELQGGNIA